MNRSSRKKINKETEVLNDTWDNIDLTDIYRNSKQEQQNILSVHRMFFRVNHMLGHKVSLIKFKKTEIRSSIFSDHNVNRPQLHKKSLKKQTHGG